MTDCEEIMNRFVVYDEKIVKGFIVQIFYYVRSLSTVKQNDQELKDIAAGTKKSKRDFETYSHR